MKTLQAIRDYWNAFLSFRHARAIERMDADHMKARCAVCLECTVCNLRPCSANNGIHTPRMEEAKL